MMIEAGINELKWASLVLDIIVDLLGWFKTIKRQNQRTAGSLFPTVLFAYMFPAIP